MTDEHIARDPIIGALGSLPVLTPDWRRVERTRTRGHAILARRHATGTLAGAWSVVRWWRILEPGLAAAVSVAFLAEVVRRALLLYRF